MNNINYIKFKKNVPERVKNNIRDFAKLHRLSFTDEHADGIYLMWDADKKPFASMPELAWMKCWPGVWSNIVSIKVTF